MVHFVYNYFLTRKPPKKGNKIIPWLYWQIYKYLKVYLITFYKNVSKKSLGIDNTNNVVVSLTSFPARINVVYLSIRSILYQTQKPKKVVLWLGEEQFPLGEETLPDSLLELKSLGLEIEFCKDIKAHKKYFFAFQKYPNNLLVTVDDDVIYPRNLLTVLCETQRKYPNCVIANRVRLMEMSQDEFKPYRGWKINEVGDWNPSKRLFSTGVGGVMYQPDFFSKTFFDIEGIKKTNCSADDVWLKAGQIANNVSVAFTDYYFKQFIEIPDSQNESLYASHVFGSDNDRQVVEVFDYFSITKKSFE